MDDEWDDETLKNSNTRTIQLIHIYKNDTPKTKDIKIIKKEKRISHKQLIEKLNKLKRKLT